VAASRFHSPQALLQRQAERAEQLAADAAQNAAGDASIACTGDREFPIKLSDTALYVTDMQGDFLLPEGRVGQFYSAKELEQMQPVIENCHRLVTAARAAGITIAYGRSHRFGAEVRRDLICDKSSDDTYNVIEQLRPRQEDIVVDKWTWGIFASTDLEQQLRDRGIRRLIVCGVATNVCVTNMVFQAVDRFFRNSLSEPFCTSAHSANHSKRPA
jgi:nicotinamidase-related amidase